MARGGRDEIRGAPAPQERDPSPGGGRSAPDAHVPGRDLTLPRTDVREPVSHGHTVYHLRGSETRLLATVGTFRVVPAEDLEAHASARDVWHGDFQRLADQGLITRTRIVIEGRPTAVVALTRAGKAVLEAHEPAREDGREQRYHAGLVKPRELAHDAQLYRLYQIEAARIEDEGGRVSRVVLDYELKHEYQTFLHRKDRPEDQDPASDLHAFAAAHRLPVLDGHLELPDVRLEVETPDGRLEVRDLELVTEHYSRGQLAGKARAGFTLYRSAGGGGNARTGGTPLDPRHLVRLG
jgi:DNA-binding PadR family transcriptional regulator